jgi:hypothetical protein
MRTASTRLTLLAAGALVTALLAAGPASSKAAPKLAGTVGPGSTFLLYVKPGLRVTSLPAGPYSFSVNDFSATQNFHLLGPGVNVKTGVKAKGFAAWPIRLSPGTYRYFSDAAPKRFSFTVRVVK